MKIRPIELAFLLSLFTMSSFVHAQTCNEKYYQIPSDARANCNILSGTQTSISARTAVLGQLKAKQDAYLAVFDSVAGSGDAANYSAAKTDYDTTKSDVSANTAAIVSRVNNITALRSTSIPGYAATPGTPLPSVLPSEYSDAAATLVSVPLNYTDGRYVAFTGTRHVIALQSTNADQDNVKAKLTAWNSSALAAIIAIDNATPDPVVISAKTAEMTAAKSGAGGMDSSTAALSSAAGTIFGWNTRANNCFSATVPTCDVYTGVGYKP